MAGLTFGVPTATDPNEQRRTLDALGPAQRAIQVLSLSLPKFLNTSQSIAPRSLLVAPPATPGQGAAPTTPESAVLHTLLRTLMPAVDQGPLGGGELPPGVGPATMPAGGGGTTGAPNDDLLRRIIALVTAQPAMPTFTPGGTQGPITDQPTPPASGPTTMPMPRTAGPFTPNFPTAPTPAPEPPTGGTFAPHLPTSPAAPTGASDGLGHFARLIQMLGRG